MLADIFMDALHLIVNGSGLCRLASLRDLQRQFDVLRDDILVESPEAISYGVLNLFVAAAVCIFAAVCNGVNGPRGELGHFQKTPACAVAPAKTCALQDDVFCLT